MVFINLMERSNFNRRGNMAANVNWLNLPRVREALRALLMIIDVSEGRNTRFWWYNNGHPTFARFHGVRADGNRITAGNLIDGNSVPLGDEILLKFILSFRDAFAHFRLLYDDLSPTDYFNSLGHDVPAFVDFPNNTENYRIFLTNGHSFHDRIPWNNNNLTIIDTNYVILRYWLHKFLVLALFPDGGQYGLRGVDFA